MLVFVAKVAPALAEASVIALPAPADTVVAEGLHGTAAEAVVGVQQDPAVVAHVVAVTAVAVAWKLYT